MEKVKVVLLDIDGVVVRSENFSVQYEKQFGINNDEMLPFFKRPFQACLIGKADLKKEVRPWLEKWNWSGTAEELLEFWFKVENKIDDRVVRLIKSLRKKGVKCYTATNQEKYRTEYMKNEMGFEDIFDKIFSSADLGCKKPDLEFFQKILSKLEVEAGEVLFFDDDQKNVDSATEIGINSFLYIDFDKFNQEIKMFIT